MTDRDGPKQTGDDEKQAALLQKLEQLTLEHRDLDAVIADLLRQPALDAHRIQRLKKRKLNIKDEIRQLNHQLLPDIIA